MRQMMPEIWSFANRVCCSIFIYLFVYLQCVHAYRTEVTEMSLMPDDSSGWSIDHRWWALWLHFGILFLALPSSSWVLVVDLDLAAKLLLLSLSGLESLIFLMAIFASLAGLDNVHRYFLLTRHMQGKVIDGAKCNFDTKLFCDCRCSAFFASEERARTLANRWLLVRKLEPCHGATRPGFICFVKNCTNLF